MISRIVQFEFRREIISSLLSKHDRWTPITPRIPVFAHPPWLENEFHHLSLPPSKPALGDFCRLLPDPLENWLSPFVFAGEKANFLSPPPPSLLTPMIDHFDLIIGYTTIASKSRKRRNRRG